MKRFLIVFLCLIAIPSFAYADDKYDEYINSYDFSAFDELPDDARKIMDDLGISDFDYESINNISLKDVIIHIVDIFSQKASGPVKAGLMLLCFVILASFCKGFSSELCQNDSSFYSTITSLIISVFLVVSLKDCIALCCSTIELCANFAYAFFPVFCIIVASSGGTLTSFTANTMLLTLAQGLNLISRNFFIPASNCFLAVSICSGIRSELNLNGLISIFKKIIISGISIMSTIFVTILSIKTSVTAKTDVLGVRSIKFAINSVVPVIGGSISEGLLSIQSYSGLIKTSVGVIGIIAVTVIFLPALIEVVIWRGVLTIASMCAEIFSDEAGVRIINCFSDMLLICNVILILSLVTTIISIGILVAVKTGV